MRISQLLERTTMGEPPASAPTWRSSGSPTRSAAASSFLLTAHEGPDGDALGSLLGMHHLLTQLGKDSVMFLPRRSSRCRSSTASCRWRRSSTSRRPTWPTARRSSSTAATSTGCRSTSSPTAPTRSSTSTTTTTTPTSATSTWSTSTPPAPPRSSTSWRCCSASEITPEMASALYVGLITDTGKFMYENTNARTHRIAADLIEAGRRRRRHLPPPLRARADREDPAGRPRPGRHPAPLRRSASCSPTSPPTTTRRPGPARR